VEVDGQHKWKCLFIALSCWRAGVKPRRSAWNSPNNSLDSTGNRNPEVDGVFHIIHKELKLTGFKKKRIQDLTEANKLSRLICARAAETISQPRCGLHLWKIPCLLFTMIASKQVTSKQMHASSTTILEIEIFCHWYSTNDYSAIQYFQVKFCEFCSEYFRIKHTKFGRMHSDRTFLSYIM